jgi:hypothetical protein
MQQQRIVGHKEMNGSHLPLLHIQRCKAAVHEDEGTSLRGFSRTVR